MQREHQLRQGWEFALPPFSLSASSWLDVHSSMFFSFGSGWGADVLMCLSSLILNLLFETGSLWTWSSLIQSGCLSSKLQGSSWLPSWCWDYRCIPQQSGFHRGSEGSNPGHHMWCNSFIHRATTASTARSNLSYCYIWGVGFFIDFVLN